MRAALFAIAGLLLGSFLTVVVSRLPRSEGIARGRSKCPSCGAPIRPRDNIPLVSWLLLRGRCRDCGVRISAEYPLTELGTAGLFAGASLAFEDLVLAIPVALFLAILLTVGLIDAHHRIVPNRIVYPSLIGFAVLVGVGDLAGANVSALDALIGMLSYGLPLLLIAFAVPGGMGMGDVKLVALIGLVLGALGLRYVAVAAGVGLISGGLGGVVALALGYGRKRQIPFGPFLAFGAAVSLLIGPAIADLYLRVSGLSG